MSHEPVSVLGAAMTDMSRRDLSAEVMTDQAAREALADAGVDPARLDLVVVSNALGGRLCDQGCIRGEAWLRKTALGDVPIVNVDNSCASGSSALHLGVRAALATDRPVLVLGVEKMLTGDRAATLAGIEDGLAADYRADMHARFKAEHNPSGSVLMGMNDLWARQFMSERGTTLEQVAAAAAKAHTNGARNPVGQVTEALTVDDVLSSPQVAGVLTRKMCSSFCDGAAAIVLGRASQAPADTPRIIGSVARSGNGEMDYHDRLSQTAAAAWEDFGVGPGDFDLAEIHDATSAEELYALESLGLFAPGEAGPATLSGDTAIGGKGLTVNPSGGLVGRGHPLGATGVAQVVEVVTHLRRRGGDRQVEGARLALTVNTGGIIQGDAAYVGMIAVASGN